MNARAKKGKGCGFWILVGGGVFVGLAAIGALLPDTDTEAATEPRTVATTAPKEDPSRTSAVFRSVTDGDTIETDQGTVRLIGIDAPERGECGYEEASSTLSKHFSDGRELVLILPDGQNDTDKNDRLLRYVTSVSGSVDTGFMQIKAGNAVARYDSSDGYPEHPRESSYHDAQTATLLSDGTVQIPSCIPAPEPEPAPVEEPAVALEWFYEYSSCAALKRNAVGHPVGPFNVNNPDEAELYNWFANGTGHRGDGDGDGLACE